MSLSVNFVENKTWLVRDENGPPLGFVSVARIPEATPKQEIFTAFNNNAHVLSTAGFSGLVEAALYDLTPVIQQIDPVIYRALRRNTEPT